MNISLNDLKKLDIRIGKVISAEKIKDSGRLMKLEIDLGAETRVIVTGMAEFFEPSHFVGKEIPVLANIEPKVFKGVKSHGMILAADVNGTPILIHPEQEIPAGSIVK